MTLPTALLDRVMSWTGWCLPELLGVVIPAGVAVSVTPWAWLVSAGVAVYWTATTQLGRARQRAAARPRRDLRPAEPDEPENAVGGAEQTGGGRGREVTL